MATNFIEMFVNWLMSFEPQSVILSGSAIGAGLAMIAGIGFREHFLNAPSLQRKEKVRKLSRTGE